jgi:hypothetical protein
MRSRVSRVGLDEIGLDTGNRGVGNAARLRELLDRQSLLVTQHADHRKVVLAPDFRTHPTAVFRTRIGLDLTRTGVRDGSRARVPDSPRRRRSWVASSVSPVRRRTARRTLLRRRAPETRNSYGLTNISSKEVFPLNRSFKKYSSARLSAGTSGKKYAARYIFRCASAGPSRSMSYGSVASRLPEPLPGNLPRVGSSAMPLPPQMSPVSAHETRTRAPETLFVDVRSPQEFAAGHAPGAVNIRSCSSIRRGVDRTRTSLPPARRPCRRRPRSSSGARRGAAPARRRLSFAAKGGPTSRT